MEQIVKGISRLKGVHHASIYKDGEQLASTFDEEQHDAIINSAEIISQIFSALEAIEQSHNEIFFSIGKHYLAGYLLKDSYIVILLTEKKINFPLINMGIKSAAGKIAHKIREQEKEQEREKAKKKQQEQERIRYEEEKAQEQQIAAEQANQEKEQRQLTETKGSDTIGDIPTNTTFKPIFDELSHALVEYLGPAAQFVIDDSVGLWKSKYLQNADNLSHLVELIQEEIDIESEKEQFARQAKKIIEQHI